VDVYASKGLRHENKKKKERKEGKTKAQTDILLTSPMNK
jgi:hypothetical protein